MGTGHDQARERRGEGENGGCHHAALQTGLRECRPPDTADTGWKKGYSTEFQNTGNRREASGNVGHFSEGKMQSLSSAAERKVSPEGGTVGGTPLDPAFDSLAQHLVVDPIDVDDSKVRPLQLCLEGNATPEDPALARDPAHVCSSRDTAAWRQPH